jgi:hypothetical protein
MGKYSERPCFSDVIEKKPDDVLAYNHLGSIHALSGKHASPSPRIAAGSRSTRTTRSSITTWPIVTRRSTPARQSWRIPRAEDNRVGSTPFATSPPLTPLEGRGNAVATLRRSSPSTRRTFAPHRDGTSGAREPRGRGPLLVPERDRRRPRRRAGGPQPRAVYERAGTSTRARELARSSGPIPTTRRPTAPRPLHVRTSGTRRRSSGLSA